MTLVSAAAVAVAKKEKDSKYVLLHIFAAAAAFYRAVEINDFTVSLSFSTTTVQPQFSAIYNSMTTWGLNISSGALHANSWPVNTISKGPIQKP